MTAPLKLPDDEPSILDQCWEWNGHRAYGYGIKTIKYKNYRVHRLAWEWANGPIPEGMRVLHRCDNPPCCNPRHLFLGTDLDNARDKVAKGRHPPAAMTHCKRGHEFNAENTTYWRNKRYCLACRRVWNKAWRHSA